MKKVLYVATSPSHKRAFQAFMERLDLVQAVAGPGTPDEYSKFNIRKIYTYKNKSELQGIINKFQPDVYVEASLPCAQGLQLPSGCKKVYVSHGLVGNHVKGIIKTAGLDVNAWRGCDLYCGAWDDVFIDWIKHAARVSEDKILTNALPQLDILHNGVAHNRVAYLKRDFPQKWKVDRAVMFFGFCCKDRADFHKHNEDYFHTAISLSKASKTADFLAYIKPRQEKKKLMNYLKLKSRRDIAREYEAIYKNSERVSFIGPMPDHVLDYYFADVFVTNGCSTAEIEACALQKPLFVVRSKENLSHGYDPYDTVKSGAAVEVTNPADLGLFLKEYFDDEKHHYPEKQRTLLINMGIDFDGNACERIQDRILEL